MARPKALPAFPVEQFGRLDEWADLDPARTYTWRRCSLHGGRWYVVEMWQDARFIGRGDSKSLLQAASLALSRASKA